MLTKLGVNLSHHFCRHGAEIILRNHWIGPDKIKKRHFVKKKTKCIFDGLNIQVCSCFLNYGQGAEILPLAANILQ